MATFSTIQIAEFGDVYLICGTPNRAEKLLVSSHVLRLASPKFDKELHIKRPERQKQGSTAPFELYLPDDPRPAEYFCRTLHHQTSRDFTPSPQELLKVLQLAERYKCIDAILPTAERWIQGVVEKDLRLAATMSSAQNWLIESLLCLYAAAFYLDSPKLFARFGRELILAAKQDLSASTLPWELQSIIIPLNTAINDSKHKAADFIERQMHRELGSSFPTREANGGRIRSRGCRANSACAYQTTRYDSLARAVELAQLWPTYEVRNGMLKDIFKAMKTLKFGFRAVGPCCSECDSHIRASAEVIYSAINEEGARLEASLPIICLECAKSDEPTTFDRCGHRRYASSLTPSSSSLESCSTPSSSFTQASPRLW